MTTRVLVTHPSGTWPSLTARFAGTPVLLQMTETTIEVDPIDPRPSDEAFGRLDVYDWLVVTSRRGVRALLSRLGSSGRTGLPPGLRVATVGPATARALTEAGTRVDLVAEEARSEGLAASLGPRLARGARVLIVRPEGAPGVLAAKLRDVGAVVDEAPLYRTVASGFARELADAAIDGAFGAVAFTAPSSLDLWLDAAGQRRGALTAALSRVARVAIGPTTSAHLATMGLRADAVAERPSEDAVGDAIARALGL